MVKGFIHSFESMGLVDGPGIRNVVFMQGCRLRCAYCHNPDTWDFNCGNEITSEQLLNKVKKYKTYFKASNGGVTLSGGEPLMQPEFVIDFFKKCKEENIHTTLDTAGFGLGDYDEILKYTDLVMLDIKHINKEGYKFLTGGDIKEVIKFKEALNKRNTKLWIRHVVVPGLTDSVEHINSLKEVINQFNNVEKIELLGYHTLGVNKYDKLGIPYRLKNVNPMDKNELKKLQNILK